MHGLASVQLQPKNQPSCGSVPLLGTIALHGYRNVSSATGPLWEVEVTTSNA